MFPNSSNNRGRNQYTGKTQLDWLIKTIEVPTDECILWPFTTDREGYGRLIFEGKKELAHRVAYKLVLGDWPIPCGRHTCDVPPCINPRHVIPGTQQQNVGDRVARGRCNSEHKGAHGLANGNGKLSDDDVRAIRKRAATTLGYALAQEYGVSRGAISNILSRKRRTVVE